MVHKVFDKEKRKYIAVFPLKYLGKQFMSSEKIKNKPYRLDSRVQEKPDCKAIFGEKAYTVVNVLESKLGIFVNLKDAKVFESQEKSRKLEEISLEGIN